MGTGSAVSGIQILCNYSIEDRYGLFGSGMKDEKKFKKKMHTREKIAGF
jgi:hypothetical protein